MLEVEGDIWEYYDHGNWVVITVNGDIKASGEAVMGKGIALQAKLRFPKLPVELAYGVKAYGACTLVFSSYHLFTLATKYHWRDKSDLNLIEDNVIKLVSLASMASMKYPDVFPLYLPRLGCANGLLLWEDVRPIMSRYLDDNFVVLTFGKEK